MTEQTHWEGCWTDERHYLCAIAKVRELEAEVARLRTNSRNYWKLEATRERTRAEAAKIKLVKVREQVVAVSTTGMLPDGDHVNMPTRLWLEELEAVIEEKS